MIKVYVIFLMKTGLNSFIKVILKMQFEKIVLVMDIQIYYPQYLKKNNSAVTKSIIIK
jgi:hypothetical protein